MLPARGVAAPTLPIARLPAAGGDSGRCERLTHLASATSRSALRSFARAISQTGHRQSRPSRIRAWRDTVRESRVHQACRSATPPVLDGRLRRRGASLAGLDRFRRKKFASAPLQVTALPRPPHLRTVSLWPNGRTSMRRRRPGQSGRSWCRPTLPRTRPAPSGRLRVLPDCQPALPDARYEGYRARIHRRHCAGPSSGRNGQARGAADATPRWPRGRRTPWAR